MKNFFEFKNITSTEADLFIYGEIVQEKSVDWWTGEESQTEIGLMDFKKSLDELGNIQKLNIYINSPGGDVFTASTMISMLERQKDKGTVINVYVDGLSASAASFLMFVADNIYLYKNSIVMVHKPMSWAVGNANDMQKTIDALNKIEDSVMIPMYLSKAKCDEALIKELIDAETWLSSAEMQEYFNVTVLNEEKVAVACITSKLFDRYRIIGICLLIMIGTDLVLIQIRQALAMTFFLYAFVAAVKNKSNLKILALLIICSLSHKSGVVVSTLFFLFVIISKEPIKISRTVFAIETLVFGIFLFVSFDGLINYFINVGIFPKQIVNSFNEHFFYKNIAPREIFLHVPVLLILSLVPDNRTDKLSLCSRVVSFIYVLFVALFYKYQIFLNRFLLYLLPVTCLYTINLLYYNYNNTLKSSRLYSQTFMVCVIFLGMFITIQYARSIKDPLNMVRMDTKTIFDVMFKKEEERESIRQEQLEKSRIYWEYYYKLGKKKLLDKNKMR